MEEEEEEGGQLAAQLVAPPCDPSVMLRRRTSLRFFAVQLRRWRLYEAVFLDFILFFHFFRVCVWVGGEGGGGGGGSGGLRHCVHSGDIRHVCAASLDLTSDLHCISSHRAGTQ